MSLQKTQLFQRKRWNPKQSNATTLPGIRKQYPPRLNQSNATSQSSVTVAMLMNHNPVMNESRNTNFHYSAYRSATNQKYQQRNATSQVNPLNILPLAESTVTSVYRPQPVIARRQEVIRRRQEVNTPIMSLNSFGNIWPVTQNNTKNNNRLSPENMKFKLSLNQDEKGQINSYKIQEQPKDINELRTKEHMLEVYALQLKEQLITYKKEIAQLSDERQKLSRKRQYNLISFNPKDIKNLQQVKQKLKKLQEYTNNSDNCTGKEQHITRRYCQLYNLQQTIFDKLPNNYQKVINSMQFQAINERLKEVNKMLDIKNEALENLKSGIVRVEEERMAVIKARTDTLLYLAIGK